MGKTVSQAHFVYLLQGRSRLTLTWKKKKKKSSHVSFMWYGTARPKSHVRASSKLSGHLKLRHLTFFRPFFAGTAYAVWASQGVSGHLVD